MFEMVLGHLVGDYLLQNNWMALNKGKYDKLGWLSCTVHCILYTIAVCTLMWNWSLSWVIIVFLSHFIFDKFGFADKYLMLIGGRSLTNFVGMNYPIAEVFPTKLLQSGFTAFVYAVSDNTMHILTMYLAYKFLI